MHLPVGLRLHARRLVHFGRSLPPLAVRFGWFKTKRLLGIPTRSDRSYLVRQLVAGLDRGQIGPLCHIMAQGRHDGAGAQAMARMSALCLARHYGLRYVHTPFETMDHSEGPPTEWAAKWEKVFNIGDGELTLDKCKLPVIGIERFMANKDWWMKPCILTAGHFVRFTDRDPGAYHAIIPELRRKHALTRTAAPRERMLCVAAHVRRGDVSAIDPETSHRSPDLVAIENAIKQVKDIAARLGVPTRIRIYSQGGPAGLESLEALGCELHLDTPALSTFEALVDADVLLMGRSSFSFTAALLNEGVKVYDPFDRPAVPGWLVRDANGLVDAAQLQRLVVARAVERELCEGLSARPRGLPQAPNAPVSMRTA